MTLTLLAVSLNEHPLTQPITARFDVGGGTIGRADHNTLALPDPERHISRLQAEVVGSGDGFLIRNVGAANPIVVGSRTLVQGEAEPLSDGAEVRIGGYLLIAQCRPDADGDSTRGRGTRPATPRPIPVPMAAPAAASSVAPVPPPPPSDIGAGNPFADLLRGGAAGAGDPFAALLGAPTADASSAFPSSPPAPQQPPTPPTWPTWPPVDNRASLETALPNPDSAPARLPDDFNPFAAPRARAMPTHAPSDDPFAGLLPSPAPPSIDRLFDLQSSGDGSDPLAAFLADASAPAAGPAGAASTDPLAMFAPARQAGPARPPARVQRDDLPVLHTAYSPPELLQPAAPAAPQRLQPPAPPPAAAAAPAAARPPAPAVSRSGGSAASAEDAWSAFCAGAGIAPGAPAQGHAEALRQAGRMLRGAVDGTLQLMAVRASAKHELRAAVTVIQARSNNPLKFSPDARSAVEQLLAPPARGFLDGPAAVSDAMRDLVGHSIGTVAGMRAAIDGMLGRFDPTELQAQLGADSVLDKLLPMNRSARLWELYLQHHRRIRDDAQDDFHSLFGKAFLAAYQQQVQRLAQAAAAEAAAQPRAEP